MRSRQVVRLPIIVASLILAATFTVLVWGTLSSDTANAHNECTLLTVEGTYLFEAQGMVSDDDGNVQRYAEAGTWTLDGEGLATGFISIGIDGANLVTKEPFTATYELVSECVYEVRDEFDLVVDLYTTPAGSNITYYSPAFSGTMFKQ